MKVVTRAARTLSALAAIIFCDTAVARDVDTNNTDRLDALQMALPNWEPIGSFGLIQIWERHLPLEDIKCIRMHSANMTVYELHVRTSEHKPKPPEQVFIWSHEFEYVSDHGQPAPRVKSSLISNNNFYWPNYEKQCFGQP